jgi:hypothetical protein
MQPSGKPHRYMRVKLAAAVVATAVIALGGMSSANARQDHPKEENRTPSTVKMR